MASPVASLVPLPAGDPPQPLHRHRLRLHWQRSSTACRRPGGHVHRQVSRAAGDIFPPPGPPPVHSSPGVRSSIGLVRAPAHRLARGGSGRRPCRAIGRTGCPARRASRSAAAGHAHHRFYRTPGPAGTSPATDRSPAPYPAFPGSELAFPQPPCTPGVRPRGQDRPVCPRRRSPRVWPSRPLSFFTPPIHGPAPRVQLLHHVAVVDARLSTRPLKPPPREDRTCGITLPGRTGRTAGLVRRDELHRQVGRTGG